MTDTYLDMIKKLAVKKWKIIPYYEGYDPYWHNELDIPVKKLTPAEAEVYRACLEEKEVKNEL